MRFFVLIGVIVFSISITSFLIYDNSPKKSLLILNDDCTLSIPQKGLDEYDEIVDSTINAICLKKTHEFIWEFEPTGGNFVLKIFNGYCSLSLIHDNPNTNEIYAIFPIEEFQFDSVSRFMRYSRMSLKIIVNSEQHNFRRIQYSKISKYEKYIFPEQFEERLQLLYDKKYEILFENVTHLMQLINGAFKDESNYINIDFMTVALLKKNTSKLIIAQPKIN